MNTNKYTKHMSLKNTIALAPLMLASVLMFQNCGVGTQVSHGSGVDFISGGGGGSTDSSSNTDAAGGVGSMNAGNGANISGTGALSVPTANAVVQRLQNNLGTSSTAGNFAKALVLVKTNLPQVTDPTKATGYDQVQLLAYAACSDLKANMNATYKVNPNGTIASNQAALVAAGVSMLDKYTGGLASQGPTASQVSQAFTNLVTTVAATQGNTSTIAFVSVCIAANVTGATMLGF